MVDDDLVKRVAKIARINLTDEEIIRFTKEFSDIIKWFEELSKVDTSSVEPSFHPLRTENVFRSDEVRPCLSQEESLSNTSHKENGYFKGPRAV